MPKTTRTVFAAAGLALAIAATSALPVRAEAVLRIAMTAGDIPDWTGQPDQGFEGYRFVGFNLYDGLINWDMSKAGVEVRLKPGLATEWMVDPNDHKRWVLKLRPGVKFHDGCAWNADIAVWNFERLMSDKSPAFSPANFARARSRTNDIDHVEKVDDMTIAIYTKQVNSLMPYNLPFVLMMSKCALEKAGNDYKVYASAPSGTGPYRFDKVVPHERLELVKNPDYWDPNRVPKHDRVVLLPMPEATTRAAALLSGQVDMIEAPSPDMIPRLKSAGMNVITHPYPHIWPYLLNFQRGPFRTCASARRRTTRSTATKWSSCWKGWRSRATPATRRRSETTGTRSNTNGIRTRRRHCSRKPTAIRARYSSRSRPPALVRCSRCP